jgi:predicted ester cyclase
MSLDDLKAVARRVVDAIARADAAAVDDLVSPDVVAHDPGVDFHGPAQLKAGIAHLHAAFPDLRLHVDDLFAEGDRVAVRYTGRGSHQGEFRGIAPTGKPFVYTGMMIMRIAGGRLIEYWASPDLLGLFRQLGVVRLAGAGEPAERPA